MGSDPEQKRSFRRRFLTVGTVHSVNGTAEPQLAVWWPTVQRSLGLTDGQLGALQLMLPVGLSLGATIGGRIADRLGTRKALAIGSVGFFGAMAAFMHARHWALAAVILLAIGIGNGVYDVAQGTNTSALEIPGKRRHTLIFKGIFSIVATVSAAVAGIVVAAGVTPQKHLLVASGAALAVVFGLLLWQMEDIRPEQPTQIERAADLSHDTAPGTLTDRRTWAERKASLSAAWHARKAERDATREMRRATTALALLAASAALPLGVLYTRGAFVFEELGATGGARAIGLTVFSIAQFVVQITTWYLSDKEWLSPRIVALVGGWAALAGSITVIAASIGFGGWVAGAVGVGLLGAGLAPVSAMAQSVAGQRFPEQRALAVGSVVRLNHVGIASAPLAVLLVGLVVDLLGSPDLTLAAGIVMALCSAAVAFFAVRVFRSTAPAAAA